MFDFQDFMNKMVYIHTNTQDAFIRGKLISVSPTRLTLQLYSGAEFQVMVHSVLQISKAEIKCPYGQTCIM
jgi:hypothetical protein